MASSAQRPEVLARYARAAESKSASAQVFLGYAALLRARPEDKTTLVATSVVFFLVVNYVKLVPYHFLGQLNLGNLTAALLFAPLAPIGIWMGVWLHRKVSEAAFYQIAYTLLFATGAKLVWDALAG